MLGLDSDGAVPRFLPSQDRVRLLVGAGIGHQRHQPVYAGQMAYPGQNITQIFLLLLLIGHEEEEGKKRRHISSSLSIYCSGIYAQKTSHGTRYVE